MTTLSVSRLGNELRCGPATEPARARPAMTLVVLFLVILAAVVGTVPATSRSTIATAVSAAMPRTPGISIADLGVADDLLSAAAAGDGVETRELVQCHRHAYRHHIDPATCESAAP